MYIDDKYYVSGADGNVLTAVATTTNIPLCQQLVYNTLNEVLVCDKQYRTDIGNRPIHQLPSISW
jgi:phosphoribosylamine-glycine ligase